MITGLKSRAWRAVPGGAPALFAGLAALILCTWIVTARLMGGMDAGPGTPLGGFTWFVASWVVMMAAMMLPAEMRFTLAFARFARGEAGGDVGWQVAAFLVGYLVSWTAVGVIAWLSEHGLRALAPPLLAWDAAGPAVAGVVVVLAGLYQVSRWKQACFAHCASPLAFFLQHWRSGWAGALGTGIKHGGYCIGCCWALMLVMFVEKVLPVGPRFAWLLAALLIGLGAWVAGAPTTVPGLTLPSAGAGHRH